MTTGTDAATVYDVFNPRAIDQVQRLAELYEHYLLEELDRTGNEAPGFPVARYLKTFTISSGNELIGFCSIDINRNSVELIYITPEHRGHGIARFLLTQLRANCPGTMRLKTPLSPAGQALADSLDIPPSEPDEGEEQRIRESNDYFHRAVLKHCRHKRGNPSRACARCYRASARKLARTVVGAYVAATLLRAAV